MGNIVPDAVVHNHLTMTEDMLNVYDSFAISLLVKAAEDHIGRLLGYRLTDRYKMAPALGIPPKDESTLPTIPDDLQLAVCMLVAWWYEQREAAGPGAKEVPFGVSQIINEHREWTF